MFRRLLITTIFVIPVLTFTACGSQPTTIAHKKALPPEYVQPHVTTTTAAPVPTTVAPVTTTTQPPVVTTTTVAPAPAPVPTTAPVSAPVTASGDLYAEWTKVAVCEEGGWIGYAGPAYPDSLGIDAQNWYANGGGSDVSPAAQIAVAERLVASLGMPNYVPDQAGCAAW